MRSATLLVLLALITTSAAGSISGVIEVGPPSGQPELDRQRIVSTLSRAEPGDTVRFSAGTYEVGPIIRVTTPDLTLVGDPDGTILRGGDFDSAAGFEQFGDDDRAFDALGVLHLFEGGTTVRGLTFADSWFGLILGWHYDEEQPKRVGGFFIEGNTFRDSQNGVRSTNTGGAPTVIRDNRFIDVHYGVSGLGSGFVVERNAFAMTEAPREQGYGEAIRIAAEHVAGECSDNRIEGNAISGHELGIGLYTDGRRTGTGNVIRGNRIALSGNSPSSTGIDLRTRADRDGGHPPTGGLIATTVDRNQVVGAAGAAGAAISIGVGCDDTHVIGNVFADLGGPAIVLGGNRTRVEGHAVDVAIRHATTADAPGQMLFRPAQADATDIDFERLAWLSAQVDRWARDGEIVGCELLVIRDGATLLHDVYGWADGQDRRPLQRGSIYCVRSMTKPFVGTVVLQLVAEGRLGLDDLVAKHLPSFANDRSGGITVRQLLTHTSGLRGYADQLALAMGIPEDEVWTHVEGMETLQELVDLVGAEGVTQTPGEYLYSDLGSSTLAALVAEVTGMPAPRAIEERILGPLGLRDTHADYTPEAPWRARMNSTHVWQEAQSGFERYWDPSQPQVMKYFEGSGGLYATTHDYARFAWAWLNGGAIDEVRLLPKALVHEALEPRADRAPDGAYGYHWLVSKARRNGMPRLFGHGGSDGTRIWVIPETRTMVLYFTQSRGHSKRTEFLTLLADVLPEADFIREAIPEVVHAWADALRNPAEVSPEALAPLAGRYRRDGGGGRIFEVRITDEGLACHDLTDDQVMTLVPSSRTTWHSIDAQIEFDLRGADAGLASGMRLHWSNGDVMQFTRVATGASPSDARADERDKDIEEAEPSGPERPTPED